MKSIRERCLGEHYFITDSYSKDLRSIVNMQTKNIDKNQMELLFKNYTNYYRDKNIFLEISKAGNPIYSSMPMSKDFLRKVKSSNKGARYISTLTLKGEKYLCVIGVLPEPYSKYTLTYLYNLSEDIASCNRLTEILFVAGIIISFLLAICLLILLNYIFKPLREISSS
jgi:hypothetical protein